MTMPLTPLQRSVIERLNVFGMEDFANRATIAWRDGARYPCTLTPAERATMEGATLCNDFKRANAEVARTAPVNTGPAGA
jgi:plasmid replication initiation protein